MGARLLFLFKYYIFWIILSVLAKVIFLIYQGNNSLEVGNYFSIFYKGLRMDLSLGGYIMMLSCVLMAISFFIKEKYIKISFSVLTFLLLLVFWSVAIGDLEIFKNWGYHVDASPLLYLKTPKEAMASTPNSLIFLLLLWMGILVASSFYLYRRFVLEKFHYKTGKYWQAVIFLLLGGLMVIPVRGGVNLAPLNNSFVFFHKTNMYANQAAINPVWNFLYEVMHMNKLDKNYHFMPSEEAHEIVNSLYGEKGDYPEILNNKRPNIIVLLLESFSADAIEVLGGEVGVTPNLNKLAREGVLFSQIYSTGNRSDRGVTGVIGASPAHPDFSLMKYPNKTAERPRFPLDLEKEGYSTRFYYAGDINFGGFRSYLTMSFQEIITEEDFSGEAKKNTFKWGIHDEYLFQRLAEDAQKAKEPFMYMVFNMSSHEPFDVPMETVIEGNTNDRKFLNAIYYTDRCIGEFIRSLKESGMWDKTLLVMIADHGTIGIRKRQAFEPETFHIPMIFSGGVVNVQDTVINTIGSQIDMVATLFAQLGLDYSAYKYSKNLLAGDVKPFAYYAFSNNIGMIRESGTEVFELSANTNILTDSTDIESKYVKAYLQVWDEDVK
ncbi:MAG: LTA synthase family protein [Odoribacter sp.]|nr:LTA synthase family protein [Odoribacter sp.]